MHKQSVNSVDLVLKALPLGFPSGSDYVSLYIPPLATIQIQSCGRKLFFTGGYSVMGFEVWILVIFSSEKTCFGIICYGHLIKNIYA